MKKIHLGSHNDYPFHSKIKRDSKKFSTRTSRRKLAKELTKLSKDQD